jgi:hypothetical protein
MIYQNFIKIEDEKCYTNGYINMNFTVKKLISGWEKALYYFGIENTNYTYDFIWFIEDDVFFYNEDTLIQIDNQYLYDDLLCNSYDENIDGNKYFWHWAIIDINFPPPYYNGMMCAVRFSKNMIKCINDYAIENKTLFFLEALFPTIAIKNNLKISTPNEFNNIVFMNHYKKDSINMIHLYHPVKNIDEQKNFRI